MNCRLSYPGLTSTTGNASGAIIRGTRPSIFRIEVAKDNAGAVAIGNLVASVDGVPVWTLVDCAMDRIDFKTGEQSSLADVIIVDRRWRWIKGGGWISGRYNIRRPDGTIDPSTAATVREMLGFLFKALGEPFWDVTAAPNVPEPVEVNWDYVRPVDALDGLLRTYGLDVVLTWDAINSVKVVNLGDLGAPLPGTSSNIRSQHDRIESLAAPEGVAAIGAPTRYQAYLELVPVGLDTSGVWRLVDDLSYRPTGGWKDVNPRFMLGLPDNVDSEVEKKQRALALQTVYRTFRVAGVADHAYAVEEQLSTFPRGDTEIQRYILGTTLFSSTTNTFTGVQTFTPAELRGIFWGKEYGLENTAPNTKYKGQFQIDAANRLVVVNEPMYRFAADGETFEFARLFLLTTFSLLNEYRSPDRFVVQRPFFSNNGAGYHGRHFPDLEKQVTFTMAWSTPNDRYQRTGESSNEQNVVDRAGYYLDGVANQMVPKEASTQPLAGITRVQLDSEIAVVSYDLSAGYGFTTVSRNTEHRTILPLPTARSTTALFEAVKLAPGAGTAPGRLQSLPGDPYAS